MNIELLDFIKKLSLGDTKSLTQKALKTAEEVGELAKAVLPYENAAGTLHRFVQRNQILENAVDTMLCALSIAYELDYTNQDIEEMMHRKTKKWSGIQSKEAKIKFPLPFEVHVTVKEPEPWFGIDSKSLRENSIAFQNKFVDFCKEIGVKPIILDLKRDGETVMTDVMTSSVHYGENNSAEKYALSIGEQLTAAGFGVVRVKIETVPWHPAAPSIHDAEWTMPENSYFESHLRIVTTSERKNELAKIAKEVNGHLSRNFFKKINANEYIIMLTLREYKESSESFQLLVDKAKLLLESNDFVVDKAEVEFALYDTNNYHDSKWLNIYPVTSN